MRLSYFWLLIFSLLASVSPVLSLSLPYSDGSPTFQRRTTPYFPPDPPSCPICERDYWNINSCAQACPVLANLSMVSGMGRERSTLREEGRRRIGLKLDFLGNLQPRRIHRCPQMRLHRHVPFCFPPMCRLVSTHSQPRSVGHQRLSKLRPDKPDMGIWWRWLVTHRCQQPARRLRVCFDNHRSRRLRRFRTSEFHLYFLTHSDFQWWISPGASRADHFYFHRDPSFHSRVVNTTLRCPRSHTFVYRGHSLLSICVICFPYPLTTCNDHDHVTTSNERTMLLLLYIESEEKRDGATCKRSAPDELRI